jgi:hypothetical protein
MKLNTFKSLIILILVGFSTSCEEYLTLTDPNLLSSDTFWRDLNDTESGLTATYVALLNHFVLNISQESCRADMGWPGYGRPSPDGSGPVDYYYQTYTSTSEEVQRKWQALYLGIFRANQVISGLEGIEADMVTEADYAEWKSQMGQARFLRGLFHFYTYQTYNNGSIIIRDELALTQDKFNKPLSTPEEVIKFIREDLEFAYKNLPAKYTEAADQGRVTAGAAATILGNSYLFEGEYAKASTYYKDVIENPDYGYKLVNDMDLLFTLAGELNEESILEICYNVEFNTELSFWDEESLSSRWAYETISNTGSLSPVWLTYAYKTEEMDPLDTRNYYEDEQSGQTKLRNVSLRASAMVTVVEDEQSWYYTGSVSEIGKFTWNGWGFGMSKKYSNHDHASSESEYGGSSWMSGKNVTLNRLAEVYINLAECVLQTSGDVQEALDLINANRARWGLVLLGSPNGDPSHTYDGITYSKDDLMNFIMYVEKPLELSNEGHMTRWIDMRRWGITGQRFQDLADETYYAIDYAFITSSGNEQSKRASIVKAIPEDYTGISVTIDYEYDKAAANYNAEAHDYYLIPNNETGVNSSLTNK